jgi:hypothetical protein
VPNFAAREAIIIIIIIIIIIVASLTHATICVNIRHSTGHIQRLFLKLPEGKN